jgi:arabinoxylan arabinofuranohydrolase
MYARQMSRGEFLQSDRIPVVSLCHLPNKVIPPQKDFPRKIAAMKNPLINSILPLDWELYIADGEPYVFEDTLYLYGSRDVPGGVIDGKREWCSQDYHVICTKDLENWEDCGVSYTIDEVAKVQDNSKNPRLWAPDVCYNPRDGRYYLYACTPGGGFFVASSDSPRGPFSGTRRMTIDGEDVFPKVIDPGVLLDDDGRAYITWPGGADHPWSIAQLDPDDFANILGKTVTPVDNLLHPFEGPSLRKRGDIYYYIYIQNTVGPKVFPGPRPIDTIKPTRMVYLTSKHPLGPYEEGGTLIDTSDYPGVINVHGSFVEWKEQWYLFYHLPVQGSPLTRMACAAPLEFKPDGSIVQVKPNSCGPRQAFLPDETIPAYTAVIFPEGSHKLGWNHITPSGRDRCDHGDPADRHLFFDRVGQYAGYRYLDFGDSGRGAFSICVQSGSEAHMEVRTDEHDGQLIARFDLQPAAEYVEYTMELLSPVFGRHAVFLVLKDNPTGQRIKVRSFLYQTS